MKKNLFLSFLLSLLFLTNFDFLNSMVANRVEDIRSGTKYYHDGCYGCCPFGTDKMQLLAEKLRNCHDLESLKIDEAFLNDDEVGILADALKFLPNLKKLDLSDNMITSVGAEKLALGLINCHSLEWLVLNGNQIGDAGVQVLVNVFQCLPNIMAICISKNNISDIGAKALAEGLYNCSSLKTLNLFKNENISIDAIVCLVKILNIEGLSIANCRYINDHEEFLIVKAMEENYRLLHYCGPGDMIPNIKYVLERNHQLKEVEDWRFLDNMQFRV